MTNRNFMMLTALICFGLMLSISAINYLTDPYGIYNPPYIKGLNGHYPSASSFSRLSKAEAMKRIKPEIVILGTSIADVGLNPDAEFFSDQRGYNFGVSAATIEEQYHNLKYAYHVNPLELVILTLDFFIYDANRRLHPELNLDRLQKQALSPLMRFLYSYGTLLSVDTFRNSLQHLRRIEKKERYSYPRKNGHLVHQQGAFIAQHYGAAHMFVQPPTPDMMVNDGYRFDYPDPDRRQGVQTSFDYLDKMLALAKSYDSDVILLFSPYHESYLEILKTQNQLVKYKEWKQRVIAMTSDYPQFALWDFSMPHPYIEEKIPPEGDLDTRLIYFWDPMHYTEALGDLIFKKILGREDGTEDRYFNSFGRKL